METVRPRQLQVASARFCVDVTNAPICCLDSRQREAGCGSLRQVNQKTKMRKHTDPKLGNCSWMNGRSLAEDSGVRNLKCEVCPIFGYGITQHAGCMILKRLAHRPQNRLHQPDVSGGGCTSSERYGILEPPWLGDDAPLPAPSPPCPSSPEALWGVPGWCRRAQGAKAFRAATPSTKPSICRAIKQPRNRVLYGSIWLLQTGIRAAFGF